MPKPTCRIYTLQFLLPEPVTRETHIAALCLLEKISAKWINWAWKTLRADGGTRMPAYRDGQE